MTVQELGVELIYEVDPFRVRFRTRTDYFDTNVSFLCNVTSHLLKKTDMNGLTSCQFHLSDHFRVVKRGEVFLSSSSCAPSGLSLIGVDVGPS